MEERDLPASRFACESAQWWNCILIKRNRTVTCGARTSGESTCRESTVHIGADDEAWLLVESRSSNSGVGG